MIVAADTFYDSTHTWQNANDRVAYQRAFSGGTFEDKTVAQAMLTANPLTPQQEIRVNMNDSYVPARYGYGTVQATIDDILEGRYQRDHIDDAHTTDFSGSRSGMEATSTPTIPLW